MNKNISLFLSVSLLVLIFSGGIWYLYSKNSTKVIYSVNNTPALVLETQNKNYAEALSYEKEKKYSLALLAYQKALPEAKDKTQSAQIQLKIAIMNEWLGNYIEAISQLKVIAADTTNYSIARAYAVQEIGFMNIYTTGDTHQLVFTETFKDTPYSSFKEDGNLNLTYTKLFEHAASIYPLGYSESYIAYGYSGEILNTLRRATTTPQAIEYISLIEQSLRSADVDIRRMRTVPGERGIVPVALAWQGVALSRLASVGVVDPEQAEPYFKESVTYGATLGDRPGNFNAFNYAAFLVYHYGDARAEDIKNLLLPFRSNNDTQIYPQVINFYKTVRVDKNLGGDKKQIISMAQIDSNFKEYLMSLGWKKSDF